MDDPRNEAPQLSLTSHADEAGDEALQLTPSDSVAGYEFGGAFDVGSKPVDPSPGEAVAESAKQSKHSAQLGDQQFVAALLGQPMPVAKKKKPAKVKPAKNVKTQAAPATPVVDPAMAESQSADAPAIDTALIKSTSAESAAHQTAALMTPPADSESMAKSSADARLAKIGSEVAAPFNEPLNVPINAATDIVGESPALHETPWAALEVADIAHAAAKPPRAVRAVGPMMATAPITVHEPELLPEPPPADTYAALHRSALPAEMPAIAMLSGVPVAALAEPSAASQPIAEAAADEPMAEEVAVTAAGIETEAAEVEDESLAAAEVEQETSAVPTHEIAASIAPAAAPADDALARDFAIPIPSKPAKAEAVRAVQPGLEKIELKPQRSARVAAETTVRAAVPRGPTGAWWTLPMLFAGLMIIACALVVPVADENHRAAYELARIERDVAHFKSQADVNASFLSRVSNDPALAERLAMRQLNLIRPDEKLAPLKGLHDGLHEKFSMSPFALTSVAPPGPMPAYRPIGGFLSEWFLSPKWQTCFVGIGLLLTAAAVVFGGGGSRDQIMAERAAA